MRIYAIGDIHGQLDMLKAAHARIDADKERVGDHDARVLHLGDYVDRGPDSAGVIQYLMDGIDEGKPWRVIRGNHDRMFTRFVRHGIAHDDHIKSGKSWLHPALGGTNTLASYGVEAEDGAFEIAHMRAAKAVPEAHLDFIENAPLTYAWGDYLFVHAGIQPRLPVERQTEDDLIWIREGWLDYHGPLPFTVVHGHTALDEATHFGNRIDIDTGAGYGRPLTVLVIENSHEQIVTETGRAHLTHANPG
ncbi:metallophosphoesterase family protein [Celeribacter halophilus]|uniref:Metallophosphoesterase family protein n=1 Tax=Celeribacter halophilus TaxID=576117 RepID=A0A1I3TUL4_9RHOB|nr:metallophosphoesterase family protein [Celeribacter halophilus]MDO6456963.1 metallophosphoesterase family protein [Celeribacter halophilus]MDO6723625.1 metallophosphoesterase family protein [Celeribacter halophilus]PZX10781.1 serine/threonine protein phosphatase 1 [Celeribacter halophilus]SFJ74968.1 serine/threonine protein phosphatase 1 [Celeribacter halophilus]